MVVPFIELPYVLVSRIEYEWLAFSRNALAGLTVVLSIMLWDKCKRQRQDVIVTAAAAAAAAAIPLAETKED